MVICPNCQKNLADGSQSCEVCGCEFLQLPDGGLVMKNRKAKKKLHKKRWLFCTVLVLLAAMLVATVCICALLGEEPQTGYTLYFKNKQLYYTNYTDAPVRLTDQLYVSNTFLSDYLEPIVKQATLSGDGSMLFYPDKITMEESYIATYTLCYRYTDDLAGKATKIASSVLEFFVDREGNCVTYRDADKSVYRYDIASKSKTKLAEDTVLFLGYDDGDVIFYATKTSTDRQFLLTRQIRNEQPESVVVTDLDISEDGGTVYYSVGEDVLYRLDKNGTQTKIGEQILRVYAVYNDGSCYLGYSDGQLGYCFENTVHPLSDLGSEVAFGEYSAVAVYFSDAELCIAVGDKVTRIKQAMISDFAMNRSGDTMYYKVRAEVNGEKVYELYRVEVADGKAKQPVLCDSGVSAYADGYFVSDERFVYFKETENDRLEMYCDGKLIDSDLYMVGWDSYMEAVEPIGFSYGAKRFIYVKYNDEGEQSGLYAYDGEITKIYDGKVHARTVTSYGPQYAYTVTPEGDVLYLADDDDASGTCNLYRWDGEENILLDDSVSLVFS